MIISHDQTWQQRYNARSYYCLAFLDLNWTNWFRKSQLMSMVAKGLRKPYAKTKVVESCTCMIFIDLLMAVDYGIEEYLGYISRSE